MSCNSMLNVFGFFMGHIDTDLLTWPLGWIDQSVGGRCIHSLTSGTWYYTNRKWFTQKKLIFDSIILTFLWKSFQIDAEFSLLILEFGSLYLEMCS